MKNNKLIVISITSAIFLSGCIGGNSNVYEQPYWKATSEKSDWDIDSLHCEEKAAIAQADVGKLAQSQARMNSMQNLGEGLGGKDLSGVFGLIGGLSQGSIHSQAKSDEFIKCMQNKSWNAKEDKEDKEDKE